MLTVNYLDGTRMGLRKLFLLVMLIPLVELIGESEQNSVTTSVKRTKHMLAVISPEDPKSIEIVPEGISWLKSIREPISFVFQFKAGEENNGESINYGLISEVSNISDSDSAGFRVEKLYVNFNGHTSSDSMRTWKLYAIAAIISSSYMIERGDHFKGAPKAMQIFNILKQAMLHGHELSRTRTFDASTMRFPSIFWIDDDELKYLTSSNIESLISSKSAIDMSEYFDSKAEELSMLDVRSRINRLARPKTLANEPMNGEQVAEFIKYLVRYLNGERYPSQLEWAFMTIYKRNYCQLEQDEKFLDKLSQLNEQLESPAITEFGSHSERVRKQIERLMCPKFKPQVWCDSEAITV